jgi:hypothetical protein
MARKHTKWAERVILAVVYEYYDFQNPSYKASRQMLRGIQSLKSTSDVPSGRSWRWSTNIMIYKTLAPYTAYRHLLIKRIASAGTSCSPLPC